MFDKIFNWAYDQNMKSNHGESSIHKKAYYASGMTLIHVFANHNYVLIYLVGKYVVKTDIYSNMLLSFPVGNYYRSPFVLERSIFSLFAHCTEVRFASFLSGGPTTLAVINPPERKLAKRTSVQWVAALDLGHTLFL